MDKLEQTKNREKMIWDHLIARGIHNPAVLNAMQEVPREKFVLPSYQKFAYSDHPLPIEAGQTISQPYIVALMTSQLQLTPQDIVLEIGTGSGYAAAILSRIVKHVYTIEYFPQLASTAQKTLQELGYTNITVIQGDGTQGLPEHAPYQAISITAGGKIPSALIEQLAIGGRLIMPVEINDLFQELTLVIKSNDNRDIYAKVCTVQFVPLL